MTMSSLLLTVSLNHLFLFPNSTCSSRSVAPPDFESISSLQFPQSPCWFLAACPSGGLSSNSKMRPRLAADKRFELLRWIKDDLICDFMKSLCESESWWIFGLEVEGNGGGTNRLVEVISNHLMRLGEREKEASTSWSFWYTSSSFVPSRWVRIPV